MPTSSNRRVVHSLVPAIGGHAIPAVWAVATFAWSLALSVPASAAQQTTATNQQAAQLAPTEDLQPEATPQAARPETAEHESADPRPSPPEVSDRAIEEGRAHFRRGVRLYRHGMADAALAEFHRAYEVAPNYRILYNLAQVQAQRQHYVRALQYLTRYEQEATAPLPSRRLASIQRDRAEWLDLVGRLRVVLQFTTSELTPEHEDKTAPEVSFFVDGMLQGVVEDASITLLDAGVHQLRFEAAGYEVHVQEISLLGGEGFILPVVMRAIAEEAQVALIDDLQLLPLPSELELNPPSDSSPTGQAATSSLEQTPTWAAVSATGVLASATALLAMSARSAQGKLDNALDEYPADRDMIEKRRTRLRLLAQATDMVGVFTVLGIGLSTYLYGNSDKHGGEHSSVSLSANPLQADVKLQWAGSF